MTDAQADRVCEVLGARGRGVGAGVLKSQEFMDRLAFAGEGVQVFAQALLLKPEAISLGDGSRIDDFTRIEGGLGVEIGRHVHISSFCSIFAGGGARLGDYSCMAQGSRILTGSEQLDAAMSSVAPSDWRAGDDGHLDRRPSRVPGRERGDDARLQPRRGRGARSRRGR